MILPTPPPESNLPSSSATVYFPNPVHPDALAYASGKFGKVIVHDHRDCADACDVQEALRIADGIVNRANPLPQGILEQCENLKGISVVGVGYDSIDIPYCRGRQISVFNCPGINSTSVSELTLTLTLCLLRKITHLNNRLKACGEERVLAINNLGRQLRGKKVGMIGMGNTARKTGELFHHAFQCPLHIYSPTSPPTRWTSLDPSGPLPHTLHSSLDDLLPKIDILTIHCPLTPLTHNLITQTQLRLMKPTAILVNMSRGYVVNEQDLCKALKEGWIASAASDVFQVEPCRKSCMNGLAELDNFVATPHIGGSTVEAQIEICKCAIDQLANCFDGHQVENRVC
uniref:Phosphoglycerate dehydrogenase n=1 Tax=Kwoniella bestiolae CBS 10118 TaxID=1296100 RepID=A0A1B9FYR8_9TREE|nr:hypothetical protein I302_06895 [Kwoniella bestiolae CBS 10118]OCF23909.1 hypothetical protein I302_06895 [Kwoniella bestiolae CBS 10118]